jgi:type IV pilus assembly protein PilX
MSRRHGPRPGERGMVLVTALLMLIVVTLIALAMFRSFGLDEKMAGNVREKQRALNAAETAEEAAEYWLANTGSANSALVSCSAMVAASVGQICTNAMTTPTQMPWTAGVTYVPTDGTTPMTVNTTPTVGDYYYTPAYYITYIGTTLGGLAKLYQIDASASGTNADTAAVVETTYIVQQSVKDLGSGQ